MPKQIDVLQSARVPPYLRRSLRINKNKAPESHIDLSEWEDVRCVICMEPPHNAVLLTCSSAKSGCRPYMCDTSARHSNCFKQYRKKKKTRYSSTTKILRCPLCRGKVLKTEKVTHTAKTFMNEKPRSCPFDDCEFSGTFSELDKHLKKEHHGLNPADVGLERQRKWDQVDAGWIPRPRGGEVVNLSEVQADIMFRIFRDIICPINARNVFTRPNDDHIA